MFSWIRSGRVASEMSVFQCLDFFRFLSQAPRQNDDIDRAVWSRARVRLSLNCWVYVWTLRLHCPIRCLLDSGDWNCPKHRFSQKFINGSKWDKTELTFVSTKNKLPYFDPSERTRGQNGTHYPILTQTQNEGKRFTLVRGNRSVKNVFKLVIFFGLASVSTIFAGSDSFFVVIFAALNMPSSSTKPASTTSAWRSAAFLAFFFRRIRAEKLKKWGRFSTFYHWVNKLFLKDLI